MQPVLAASSISLPRSAVEVSESELVSLTDREEESSDYQDGTDFARSLELGRAIDVAASQLAGGGAAERNEGDSTYLPFDWKGAIWGDAREITQFLLRKTEARAAGADASCAVSTEKVRRALFYSLFLLNATVRSVGQVAFANNTIGSVLIVLALAVGAPWATLCGCLSALCGTVVALLLGTHRREVATGLSGYNAVLCGMAVATFVKDGGGWTHLGLSVLVGVLQVVVAGSLRNVFELPVMTLPFNIVVLVVLLGRQEQALWDPMNSKVLREAGLTTPLDFDRDTDGFVLNFASGFVGALHGISQIWLVQSWPSAILILAGVSFFSRITATSLLVGSIVGSFCGLALGSTVDDVAAGLWGYNGALTAAALGGLFLVASKTGLVLTVLGVVWSSFVQRTLLRLLGTWSVPVLTLPFCIGSITVLAFAKTLSAHAQLQECAPIVDSLRTPEISLKLRYCGAA